VRARPLAAALAALVLTTTGCTERAEGERPEADRRTAEAVPVDPPELGACRVLAPADIAAASNDADPVPCRRAEHTAQTFLVGTFQRRLAGLEHDDPRLGAHVFETCDRQFRRFTGADESLALRSILSWAWFRPTQEQWDAGARWFRCDVVGGTEDSTELVTLPRTAKGVLLGIPGDRWIACVAGPEVAGAPRIPCTEPHDWRAATTVVVGKPKERYPGDRLVEVLSRDYCSRSVGAWMNYPLDYEYAYTWFHQAEWQAGNRRSVCWAGVGR
jgi:hypothetical protein